MFMLSMPWLDRRKVILAWPLTHLPDLDYLFVPHRAVGHNLFVLVPFAAVGLWAWRHGRAPVVQWMVIALIYVGSHIAMDIWAGGVTLLYPLSSYTTCYYAEIRVVTATNTPFLDAGRCSHEGVGQVAEVYTWLPSTEAALLVFLVPATLLVLAWRVWRRKPTA